MKILMLSLFLTSTFINAAAQAPQNEINYQTSNSYQQWRGWTLNPYAFIGTAASNFTFSDPNWQSVQFTSKNYTGKSFAIACLAGYHFNSHLSLNTGIAFAGYSWKQHVYPLAYGIDYLQSSSLFVQIPLQVKVASSKYNKIGLIAETGINLNFLMRMEDKIKSIFIYDEIISNDASNNTKFCPSFTLVLGMRIPVSKSTWIEGGVNGYAFLTNQYMDVPGKIYGAGIKLGMQTKLTK